MSILNDILNETPDILVSRLFNNNSNNRGDQKLQKERKPWVVPFTLSKWLCLTSTTFVLPGYYAFINGFYFFTLVNFITVLVSLWHWSNAKEDSYARMVDINWCKINFLIYFISGIDFYF